MSLLSKFRHISETIIAAVFSATILSFCQSGGPRTIPNKVCQDAPRCAKLPASSPESSIGLEEMQSSAIGYDNNINIVNRDLTTGLNSFESFDENDYTIRGNTTPAYLSMSSVVLNEQSISRTVVPPDERLQITNAHTDPYLPTALIVSTYYTNEDIDHVSLGTAFLEGPDLAVTAAHCCYSDITSDENDDGIFNPRFPDKIEFYFGCSNQNDYDLGSSYQYYAEAKIINIEYSYFENPDQDHDWAAIKLDRNIGYSTGWYGKISNWYEDDYDVFSWGYPGDKPTGTLWRTDGNLLYSTDWKYEYNLDAAGGQSGSPVFMTDEFGATYVCGIHTSGGESSNGGTIINSLIFAYLNSFVTSDTGNYTYDPLSLSIQGKSGSVWSISIENDSSFVRYVYYNKKMCFDDDARNWRNLNDLETIRIGPYSCSTVSISANWFATTVACSYCYMNSRAITYANNLNTNGTLSQHTIII